MLISTFSWSHLLRRTSLFPSNSTQAFGRQLWSCKLQLQCNKLDRSLISLFLCSDSHVCILGCQDNLIYTNNTITTFQLMDEMARLPRYSEPSKLPFQPTLLFLFGSAQSRWWWPSKLVHLLDKFWTKRSLRVLKRPLTMQWHRKFDSKLLDCNKYQLVQDLAIANPA